MRYPDGGGLTAGGRARWARVRLQAAQMSGQGTDPAQIAGLLQVSTESAYARRRAWRAGGEAALASKGPGGNPCKLDEDQLAQRRAALDAGPAASGWREDQRWTLARVADLIRRLFHVSYTLRGVSPWQNHSTELLSGSKVISQSPDLQEFRRAYRGAHGPLPKRDRYGVDD